MISLDPLLHEAASRALGRHFDVSAVADVLLAAGRDSPTLIEIAAVGSGELQHRRSELLDRLCDEMGLRIPTRSEAVVVVAAHAANRFQAREIDSYDLERDLLAINSASNYDVRTPVELWRAVEYLNENGVRGPQDKLVESETNDLLDRLASEYRDVCDRLACTDDPERASNEGVSAPASHPRILRTEAAPEHLNPRERRGRRWSAAIVITSVCAAIVVHELIYVPLVSRLAVVAFAGVWIVPAVLLWKPGNGRVRGLLFALAMSMVWTIGVVIVATLLALSYFGS